MDVLKAMRVFVRVLEAGSLTAAADGFDFSPTMVGNHLQSLEAHLGAKLLHRTTRRQTLTDFGKAYYDRCLEILALIEDAETLAQVEQSAYKGSLRITAPTIWANAVLVPALKGYMQAYPEIELDIVVTDTVLDFVENGLEAAIRLGAPKVTNMAVRPLRPYGHVLCAAPSYLADQPAPKVPDDLQHHDCVAFWFSPASEWWTPKPSWRLGRGPGSDDSIEVGISPRLRADNTFALRTAALQGMGIAFMPQTLVAEDIRAGRLIPVLPDHMPPSRPVSLIYRKDRRMSPRLKSFVEFVIDNFGVEPAGGSGPG